MKLQTCIAMVVFSAVTVVAGCTNREESSTDAAKEETAKAKSTEVAAIEKTINDLAKSMTDFPKTRDKQSVGALKHQVQHIWENMLHGKYQ
ncbi:MAG: hypothetical protein AAB433_11860 [Nitrospirota bacterium]